MAGFEATISTRFAAPWTSLVAVIASSGFITCLSRNETGRYPPGRLTYKTEMPRDSGISPYAEPHVVERRDPHRSAQGRRDRRRGAGRDPPTTGRIRPRGAVRVGGGAGGWHHPAGDLPAVADPAGAGSRGRGEPGRDRAAGAHRRPTRRPDRGADTFPALHYRCRRAGARRCDAPRRCGPGAPAELSGPSGQA